MQHVGAEARPKDFVYACMWFLIADEQITRAKNHVNKSMTMEQLLEAEQRAAEWMRKTKKLPPSSIEEPPEHRPTREKDASTA
ncbi:MAG TPA: hypothetical protein VN950_15815 [Terriglobales bacterium]|nr:hypothetical protein [Terriglobales bacterium]